MSEESKIEELREKIGKYTPAVMFCSVPFAMFGTNKMSLSRMAVYAASLRTSQSYYLSWLALKKPFLQQLWNAYGRDF